MSDNNRNENEDGHWSTGDKYNRIINDELNSFRKDAWKKQIGANLEGEGLKILDVGTGPGFFCMHPFRDGS